MEKGAQATIEQSYDRDKRVYDDRTTWLAEVLDGHMRTSFEYTYDGQELYSRDGGALTPVFKAALADVEGIAARDPHMAFELRRRYIEKDELACILQMADDELPNTMVVISDFPPELFNASADVGGYNVRRKQTMMRVITKTTDGRIVMRSQSLDQSDRVALEAIYHSLGFEPQPGELLGQRMHVDLAPEDQEFLTDQLTGVYDRSLAAHHGGEWYAGRTPAEMLNTYDFVCAQSDLIRAYTAAHEHGIAGEGLLYDLAAAMQTRFKNYHNPHVLGSGIAGGAIDIQRVLMEMSLSGQLARSSGQVFSGCGSSLGGVEASTVANELGELGYGNKIDEDEYGSLTFNCQKGHQNTRPRNKLIDKCKTCGISVKC